MDPHNSFSKIEDSQSRGLVVRISIPDQNLQKCLMLNPYDTVGAAKDQMLTRLAKDVDDAVNYGLYLPPSNGRSGKFLEEDRPLADYSLHHPIALEFKLKSRDYRGERPDDKTLHKSNTKVNQRKFMDHVTLAHVEKMMKLLDKGFDPNFQDEHSGKTPLIAAVSLSGNSCKDTIMGLVNSGAHMDFRDKEGQTALHHAIRHNNQLALKVMLDLGASPNYKDRKGLTPAYYSALLGGDACCLELLLSERATLEAHDLSKWREIHQVCKYGRVKHLEHLIFYGAELNSQNATGNTALHICSLNSHEECARVLLFRGANKDVLNYAGQTAYEVAVISGNKAIAKLIETHSHEDTVLFRQKPTYTARRRQTIVSPKANEMDHRGIDVANLKAVSVMSDVNSSLGSESPTNIHKHSTIASSSDASSSVIGGRTPEQPQARNVSQFDVNGFPSPPRSRSTTTAIPNAVLPPKCNSVASSHLVSPDSMTVQVCHDPYSSLKRKQNLQPRSPGQSRKASVKVVDSTRSPRSSPQVKLKHGQSPPVKVKQSRSTVSSASPMQLPKVFARLYPAVEGRKFIAVINYFPNNSEELELAEGDEVELLFVGKNGMWEGRVGLKQGWFPSYAVREMASTGHVVIPTAKNSDSGKFVGSCSPFLDRHTVVMQRSDVGLGFSIRGPKTVSPNLNFRPTATTPSLQRIGEVDKGGVAEMSGLRGGDHILEVNGYNVAASSHSEVIKLIKASGPELKLTIVSQRRLNPTEQKFLSLTSSDKALTQSSNSDRKPSQGVSNDSAQTALIYATPPRQRAMTTSVISKNSPPRPPLRKSSKLTLVSGDSLTQRERTSSLPSQHGNVTSELAGALAKRSAQIKAGAQLFSERKVDSKDSDSNNAASMIAQLAAQRNARVNGDMTNLANEDKVESSANNKSANVEMSEFEKALAARKAKLAARPEENKGDTPDRKADCLGINATEAEVDDHQTGAPDEEKVVRQMVRDDSGVRIKALSDAASKRQMRQPNVKTSTSKSANETSASKHEQVLFDLSAVLNAVPTTDHPRGHRTNIVSGAGSGIVKQDVPTATSETVAVVIGNETVDMDLDRVLELWGKETTVNTLHPKKIDTIYLDSEQNELVNGTSSWDNIQLPPPDFLFDAKTTVNQTERHRNGSKKQILLEASEGPLSTTDSVPFPARFSTKQVVATRQSGGASRTNDMVSTLPLPELIPGLSMLEAELGDMYPFAVPSPVLDNVPHDKLPSPPTDFCKMEGGFVVPPPETFDTTCVDEDQVLQGNSQFGGWIPLPVDETKFPIDVSMLPPPLDMPEFDEQGHNQQLNPMSFYSLPSPIYGNIEEMGHMKHGLVNNGDGPPPLPLCPPPPLDNRRDKRWSDQLPPLPDYSPTDSGVDTWTIPDTEDQLSWQHRVDFNAVGYVNGSALNGSALKAREPKPKDKLFSLNAVVESDDSSSVLVGQTGVSRGKPNKSLCFKPLLQWTVNDVSDWLRSFAMEEYVQSFHDNQIQGSHLAEMTKDDFKELGVLPLGHRLTIANAVAKLQ
ncbi:SH3 and multiple ankyrin repeat domains protein 2-like isoform X2 [Corticium candelabrum]|uniref:SH3 and multiple ankyrin repeat domains protein 2-like isoform X2 n=1 Tax=Corticium candelabrum TaxID=121492 RepID=UPI002E275EEE|nr:SH3 and multiple ankyrin repeat domains protein 2-like isoform X2 [Corticium candelabrum]